LRVVSIVNRPSKNRSSKTLTQQEDSTMHRNKEIAFLLVGLIFAAIIAAPAATAQNAAPPSLKDQLEAQYKVTKTAFNGPPTAPGTVLVIQMAGMLGCAPGSPVLAPATFKNGSLNPPGKIPTAMCGKAARQLPAGEKVYLTKIDVNPKKDRVSLRIMECDTCNGVTEPSSYKSEVAFDFAKGSLANPNVPDIEDTIAKVFTIDNSTQGDQAQQAPPQQGQPEAQPQAPAQPPAPAQIQSGQSIDDVVNALGQPEKIVDLGAKKIYVYKDLKITFTNGKVSDVQ
jgi:hypothetical protein